MRVYRLISGPTRSANKFLPASALRGRKEFEGNSVQYQTKECVFMYEQQEVVGTGLQVPVEIAEFAPSLTADDVFPTDPLPVPPAIPDAHKATINGVEVRRYDNGKGTVALV